MTRTHFIVKPRLQLKYVFIALVVVFITSISVYYAFWSSLVRSPGLEQLSSGEWKALETAYQVSFSWVVVILALGIGIESIFLFHRLIGPIYMLEKTINKIATGDLSIEVHSRRKDELKDMAQEMQGMIDNISKAVKTDRENIGLVSRNIEKGDVISAKENLSKITSWFKIKQ